MKLNNILKGHRLFNLFKHDLYLSWRSILVKSAALSATIIALTVLNNIGRNPGFSHLATFAVILFFVGYIFTAKAFIDMHSKDRAYEWFMIPASILEKFTVRLFITSVGWSVLFLVIYSFSSLAGEGLNLLIFGYRHLNLFNPFAVSTLKAVLHYLITQSVFLFGAAYFRKSHFVKTSLSIILFVIFIAVLSVFIGRIFFFQYYREIIKPGNNFNLSMYYGWDNFGYGFRSFLKTCAVIGKIVYYTLFAPFFWLLAYLRITEKEVKNGV